MSFQVQFDASEIAALKRLRRGRAFACTSLAYQDSKGAVYFGRTLELAMDLPYRLAYLPAGQAFESQVDDRPPLTYTTQYGLLAVVMPDRLPDAHSGLSISDFKVIEGFNEMGLTFSVLAYPSAGGPQKAVDRTRAALSVSDLGSWALGQFKTVAEVKVALAEQPAVLVPLALLGGVESPFHYVLHDRTGASIVIEFEKGQETIYDNPVGVMTNGPQFSWHLTNLNNYTFLSNVDHSSTTFGKLKVSQPDSGIATAALPASNTSVGRFVRAVYYSHFAEKVSDPDGAIRTLAHIMNNFDRPKGITIDSQTGGGEHLQVEGFGQGDSSYSTEYTSWTNLTDLNRNLFFLRTYDGLNYTMFDLGRLAKTDTIKAMPLARLDGLGADGTGALSGG